MGYYMNMSKSNFTIKNENKEKALGYLKALAREDVRLD